MSYRRWLLVIVVVLATLSVAVTAIGAADPSSIAKGGRLYDTWWKEVPGATAPKDNHPLWALQTTNKNTGSTTWRCKECHGWDYLGKDGAYGKGSHATGFVGVSKAGTSKTRDELVAILKGSTNPQHDFSKVLGDAAVGNLADFLKEGLADYTKNIDYSNKKPIGANISHGKELFTGTCAACHGADGTQINFGSETEPEYVGTVAAENPQEFMHKIRSGQPGTPMPSAMVVGWSIQDVVDVLGYTQSLPEVKLPKAGGPTLPLGAMAAAALALLGAGWGMRRFLTRGLKRNF